MARRQLIETMIASLDENDKAFLISLNRLEPIWLIYDYQNFPSVKWKILNLERFKRARQQAPVSARWVYAFGYAA